MKLLFNSDVYGWRMTGLLGKNGEWFLGYSKRPSVESPKEKSHVSVKTVVAANEVMMGKRERHCLCHPNSTPPTQDQLREAGMGALRSLRQRGRL